MVECSDCGKPGRMTNQDGVCVECQENEDGEPLYIPGDPSKNGYTQRTRTEAYANHHIKWARPTRHKPPYKVTEGIQRYTW